MRKKSTPAGARTRVLIVDDYLPFAERCRSMLEPEFEVVGIVLEGFTLEGRVSELKPDVVVIDVSMPEMSGFDAGDRVRAAWPGAKTIYMTVAGDFDTAAEAFRRNAWGFVDKTRFPDELLIAVRRALRGELHLSASLLTEEREKGSFHSFIEGRGRSERRQGPDGAGEVYEASKATSKKRMGRSSPRANASPMEP